MIHEFNIGSARYFFDGDALQLYSGCIPSEKSEKIIAIPQKGTLSKVTFVVDNMCNGQCVYCYEQEGTFGRPSILMNKDSADVALSYLYNNFKQINTVRFFGGEPTINFNIIQYIVKMLENRFSISSYEIVTNAVLISDTMLKFFITHNFKLTISIDGPDYIHNKLRPNCPHCNVISVINKIKKSAIRDKLELNCTYTKYHMQNIKYKDLIHYFDDLGAKYNISSVITEIDWLKLPTNESTAEKLIDLSYERLYSNSLNIGVNSYVSSVINALVNHYYYNEFCHDLCIGIAFDCDGMHYPCVKLIKSGVTKESEIVKNNSKDNDVCNQCWAKGLCCHCTANILLQTEKTPYDSDDCHKRTLYSYALERLIRYLHDEPEKFQAIIDHFFA